MAQRAHVVVQVDVGEAVREDGLGRLPVLAQQLGPVARGMKTQLDAPTSGLHLADVDQLLALLEPARR